MSDAKRKGTQSFKKRAHRPWKTSLLESTVQEAAADDEDLFSFDIDIDLDTTVDTSSFYPEFNFTDDVSLDTDSSSFEFESRLQEDGQKKEIRQAIMQTKEQHQQLVKQLSDKSGNSILLGGFFQPQQISANNESQTGRKINSLLSDMKVSEQKLSSLTSNLKISEAYERAEQASLAEKAVKQQLQVAESRMRQAVEQAKVAEEQFLTAMEQTKQAALAHHEESRIRRDAETHAKEAKVRANNAEIELQNERLARIAAEEKAQHAFMLAEKASLFQRQLTETSEQLVRLESSKKSDDLHKNELAHNHEVLQKEFTQLDQDHKQCATTIKKLETTVQELNEKYKDNDQLVKEFNEQRDKLKAIIAAEQDLRKNADRKYNEAMARAQKAEQAWQSEIQQRRLIEERAKRAVANASRTVLHLLNTPGDADLNNFAAQTMSNTPPPAAKAKIRVPALNSISNEEFDYEDDDLLF